MKTTTQEQHAIKIVFTTDRELSSQEIETLINRLLLEVEEPVAANDDPSDLSPYNDASYTTSDVQHAYENLTMTAGEQRIVGSINQYPESK